MSKKYFLFAISITYSIALSSISTVYAKPQKKRYIPVELWTGPRWDGRHKIRTKPANLIFGSGDHKKIVGPKNWKNPWSKKNYNIYVRTNRSKTQYFTLHPSRHGLGRVFDSRGPRYCEPGFKFPLGWWSKGQIRTKVVKCSDRTRIMKIKILEIDYLYKGWPNSLKFRWTLDAGDRHNTDNIYIYSPNRGLVHFESLKHNIFSER
ncbi:MAG: hypothetical protein AAF228_06280 [Pseudomonadota bacterium]